MFFLIISSDFILLIQTKQYINSNLFVRVYQLKIHVPFESKCKLSMFYHLSACSNTRKVLQIMLFCRIKLC